MTPSPSYEAALIYAARGWHCFPVIWGAKAPATARGFHDATTDSVLLKRWFDAQRYNIGIATQASGLVVIDIDSEAGQQRFDGFFAESPDCEERTYVVKTRSPHGRHYYYRAPHLLQLKSSAGLLGPGIDIRAAGGYVLAPPSWVDADRKAPAGSYEVMINVPVAELPYCLGTRLQDSEHPPQKPRLNPHKRQHSPETPRAVADLKDLLEWIDADCDYDTYREVIWGILSTGWVCAEELALDWSKTAPERFEQSTFETLLNTYDAAHPDSISYGTLVYHARVGESRG